MNAAKSGLAYASVSSFCCLALDSSSSFACPAFLAIAKSVSVTAMNTMAKINLGRKGFISSYNSSWCCLRCTQTVFLCCLGRTSCDSPSLTLIQSARTGWQLVSPYPLPSGTWMGLVLCRSGAGSRSCRVFHCIRGIMASSIGESTMQRQEHRASLKTDRSDFSVTASSKMLNMSGERRHRYL
ncbi:hypothetical protein STEG23_015923 [Scotinomys teguina]